MKLYAQITNVTEITPSIFYLITAHHPPCQLNRTWKFSFRGHCIFICTRCFGQYLGFLCAFLLALTLTIEVTDYGKALIYFGLLPLPATLDWFSQTMGWRESVNSLRFVTGWCYGMSLGVCLGSIWLFNLFAVLVALPIYLSYLVIVFSLLRRFAVFDSYLAPYEQFLSDIL